MNASPLSSGHLSTDTPAPSGSPVREAAPARRRSVRSLLGTITGICFVFGALLAIQLRAIRNIQLARERSELARQQKAQSDVVQKQRAEQYRLAATKAGHERDQANQKLKAALVKLQGDGTLSQAQIKGLSAQIKDLQTLACLTPMTGPGLRIVLSDNPQAAQAGANPSLPLPGLVHDYDVLQVVNELRAAKADAIAVRGAGGKAIRITGTTPIRCVGPVINIDWKPVAGPFTIEAVGEAETLRSALEMPGGIVENMKTQGAVGVKVSVVDELTVPRSDGAGATAPPSATGVSLPIPGVTSLAPTGT